MGLTSSGSFVKFNGALLTRFDELLRDMADFLVFFCKELLLLDERVVRPRTLLLLADDEDDDDCPHKESAGKTASAASLQ
jgi:hypothetical protein